LAENYPGNRTKLKIKIKIKMRNKRQRCLVRSGIQVLFLSILHFHPFIVIVIEAFL